MILTTALGEQIACETIVYSERYQFLHIHTGALTAVEAARIFSDPEQTGTLTAVDDDGAPRVYRDFTELWSVQRSPFVPDALMIWLQRPAAKNEEG